MRDSSKAIEHRIATRISKWLESRHRGGRVSRNTVATAIVVLDHLLEICPVSRADVISRGGEIRGARSGLGGVLARHGVSPAYLKEVTTRQSTTDGLQLFELLDWGKELEQIRKPRRTQFIEEQIGIFAELALKWLNAKSLSPRLDRAASPSHWIAAILEAAKGRSSGVVEQHLVGAKLKYRLSTEEIANHPAHAGDAQTDRDGDFSVGEFVYHVTAAPGQSVIDKCVENISKGLFPILLVPRELQDKVLFLIEQQENVRRRITVFAIEDFIASNIVELSIDSKTKPFEVLQNMIKIYNERLQAVETNPSLKIEP